MRIPHIVTMFLLAGQMSYAQSEESGYILMDSTVLSNPTEYMNSSSGLYQQKTVFSFDNEIGLISPDFYFHRQKDMSLPNMSNIAGENNLPGFDNLQFYAFSTNNTYVNLLDNRMAELLLNFQKNGLTLEASLIANRYETITNTTTQFGVSGLLRYNLSPHWSMAVWGTIYNSNPYFSMAAFPFVSTSSYGGWMQYKTDKAGVKLGVKRYYDGFQRQWRTEPIVTPSVRIGKLDLEFPVGPLVRELMEKLLKKKPNDGPIIMPDFN